jgi:hypothetical protein
MAVSAERLVESQITKASGVVAQSGPGCTEGRL